MFACLVAFVYCCCEGFKEISRVALGQFGIGKFVEGQDDLVLTGVDSFCFVDVVEEVGVQLFAIEAFEEGSEVDFEGVVIVDDLVVPDIDIFKYFLYHFREVDIFQDSLYLFDSCE